jgi:succinate dehydrogenase/fumarate reductase flavoprotein subunit
LVNAGENQLYDVLVLGGGGAAMVAACAAAETGASVKLISKKKPGVSSCTAYAGGGFTLATGGLAPEKHQAHTLETGRYVNDRELVDVFTAEGKQAVQQLEEWGVDVHWREGGVSVRSESLNPMVGGMGMTLPLVERCRELGVDVEYPLTVDRLLQQEFGGRVVGAEALTPDGTRHRFFAHCTVLATGGGGWLFARTDNPAGISGDGYRLALGAGARLRDMEFVQFYPIGSGPDVGTTWMMDAGILDHARLTDGDGSEFVPALFEEWGISSGREANKFERDRLSQAIARRRQETGRVVLHLEEVPEELRQHDRLRHNARLVSGNRSDPWQPVEVAPVQHFMSGGTAVDACGQTGVPGLLACGEVTGGAHGANRVGGNALTELTVFGLRAGKKAVELASERPVVVSASQRAAGFVKAQSFLFDADDVTPRWSQVEGDHRDFSLDQLRQLASQKLGPVRDGEGLAEALQQLEEWAGTAVESARAAEIHSLTLTARTIALAALLREETRGVHCRRDYPEECAEFRANIFFVPQVVASSVGEEGGTNALTVAVRPEMSQIGD